MAKPSKTSSETTVTRIKASDSGRTTTKTAKKPAAKKTEESTKSTSRRTRRNPLGPIGAYFAGAWHELRLVRWPDRRATWGMTGALLAFTGFFVIIILVLDAGFSKLFNIILGK